jgi:hypothetical protein
MLTLNSPVGTLAETALILGRLVIDSFRILRVNLTNIRRSSQKAAAYDMYYSVYRPERISGMNQVRFHFNG